MDSVHVERAVPGEPGTTFEWFTDPVLLTRWWPTEAELDVRPGGAYRLFWDGPQVTLRGEYVSVDPGRRLEFTWSWDHDDLPPRHVAIGFARSDLGSLVTVDHEAPTSSEQSDYRDGWEHFLGQLVTELSRS